MNNIKAKMTETERLQSDKVKYIKERFALD